MSKKIIEFKNDELLIEIEERNGQEISFKSSLEAGINQIKPVLKKICEPVMEFYKELDSDIEIESTEIEVGLGFEAEGNVYITKAKTEANISIKVTFSKKH